MPLYRFRFSKLGDLRFISHLDLSHAFERAARRASVPLAFSQGFHPHPKIAFATALSVGTTSSSEYVDVEILEARKVTALLEALNATLPPDLRLLDGCLMAPTAKALMASVDSAEYEVELQAAPTASRPVADAVAQLVGMESAVVRKRTKSGEHDVDIRPLIASLRCIAGADGRATLTMTLACSSRGMAKPEDVLEALRAHCGLGADARMVACHRTRLSGLRDGQTTDLFSV